MRDLEVLNRNCAKVFVPDELVSLDETLCPMKVGAICRLHKKCLSAYYGRHFRSLSSAEMIYTYNTAMYQSEIIYVQS